MNLNSLLRSPMALCVVLMGGLAVAFFAGGSGGEAAGERPSLWISLLPMLLCVGVHLLMCRGHGKDGASCHKTDEKAPDAAPALSGKTADSG